MSHEEKYFRKILEKQILSAHDKKQKERKICLYRKKVNRKNNIEMTNLI